MISIYLIAFPPLVCSFNIRTYKRLFSLIIQDTFKYVPSTVYYVRIILEAKYQSFNLSQIYPDSFLQNLLNMDRPIVS